MTIQDLGVLLFVGWILFLLLVPSEKVSLKVIMFWLAIILFCMGGYSLSLGFLAVMTIFYFLIR